MDTIALSYNNDFILTESIIMVGVAFTTKQVYVNLSKMVKESCNYKSLISL